MISYRSFFRDTYGHIWARVRNDLLVDGVTRSYYDMGPMPNDFFDLDVTIVNSLLTITINNAISVIKDVSHLDPLQNNHFKTGAYVNGDGLITVLFNELEMVTPTEPVSDTAAPTPAPLPDDFAVTKLKLMDVTDSSNDLGELMQGDVLNLDTMPLFSVQAETYPAKIGSVHFYLDGSRVSTENMPPYDLIEDGPWLVEPGSHTLVALPYEFSGGGGRLGGTMTVDFTVVGTTQTLAPTPTPVLADIKVTDLELWDAELMTPLYTLSDGFVINLHELPPIDIFARTSTTAVFDEVGSVYFYVNGKLEATENEYPYTIGGNGEWIVDPGTYTLDVIPYTEPAGRGLAGTPISMEIVVESNVTLAPTMAPTPFPVNFGIVGLTILDATSMEPLGTISNGDTIDMAAYPPFNIRADTYPTVIGSVWFYVDQDRFATENKEPYTLVGTGEAWTPMIGQHEIMAKPFSEVSGGGTEGNILTMSVTIVNGLTASPTVVPTPVPHSLSVEDLVVVSLAPSGDEDLFSLQDGDTLDTSSMMYPFTIRADTFPSVVGSVRFYINNARIKNENKEPYEINGNEPWTPPMGTFVLEAIPYTEPKGKGTAGTPRTVQITVV